MSLIFFSIIIILGLTFLTAVLKISPFIAFLLVSIVGGLLLGMPVTGVVQSVQKGIGDMLGSVVIILATGAMIGKLVAESGAAKVIADKVMHVFGEKYLSWGLLLTGLIIGIPLFYNVGFVLVIPIIFSLIYQYKLPAIQIAIPILASLSVAHSLLPPHPAPASLVGTFQASMAKTFLYGIIIAIPAIIFAGPLFAKTLKHIQTGTPKISFSEKTPTENLPSFTNSIVSALMPVFLLAITSLLSFFTQENDHATAIIDFIKEPSVLMILSLIFISVSLGLRKGTGMKKMMLTYEEGIKDIAMIILIIGASGGLKQIVIDSHASEEISTGFQSLHLHPLLLGWLIAVIIRLLLGSATVAGLTAAGIIAPMMSDLQTDPNLMVLAIGSGSIFCSHVNDTGFWMFKEYFNVSIKDTFLSWSLMETIVSVVGLLGVLLMSVLI